MLTIRFTVENVRHEDTLDPGSQFCHRAFTRQNHFLQASRNLRFGKPADIGDDGSGRRFYPFNDFEDRAALRHRARDEGSFWLQRHMFAFVPNNGFERSCDDEPFFQLLIFKKELKSILIPTDVSLRLFKSNIEGRRKIVDGA